MQRVSLIYNIKDNKIIFDQNSNQEYILDLSKIPDDKLVLNFSEGNFDLLLIPSNEKEVVFNQNPHSNLKVSFLGKGQVKSFKISANLSENSTIVAYFADFIQGNNKTIVSVNLNGERANAHWHLASLSSQNDNKEFDVSIFHNSPFTYGQSDNYGVCKNEGKLVFSGTSKIVNKSIKSKTYQNAKIMVFDRLSNAVAKPILKIDENDIEASHAAVVGKINDDHLFYLTSRGISEKEAKELITFGYLKPILVGFNDQEVIDEINKLIEGRM